jgi:predicted HicB family RNase H-like nuclease
VIHGRVINARAVLTFEGETLADLKAASADTIAGYREWCKERGAEPEKPYSGTLSLRIAPGLHRRVAEQAAKAGESINQFSLLKGCWGKELRMTNIEKDSATCSRRFCGASTTPAAALLPFHCHDSQGGGLRPLDRRQSPRGRRRPRG